MKPTEPQNRLLDVLLPLHSQLEQALRAGSIVELQEQLGHWQADKFPDQTVTSKCKHLIKEANELHDAPGDLEEMADVLLLLLGIAAKQGVSAERLVDAAWTKLEINKARTWGRPDADGVCHHIEQEEAA